MHRYATVNRISYMSALIFLKGPQAKYIFHYYYYVLYKCAQCGSDNIQKFYTLHLTLYNLPNSQQKTQI